MGKVKKDVGSSSSSSSKDSFIDVDPESVRFTHARIRPFFTGCGRRVEDTLTDIISGKMSVNDLPKITVISNDGAYFSLNNRRLYVLKELRLRGLLPGNVISARVKAALEREKERYRLDRCSLAAKIMKENDPEAKDLLDSGDGENCEKKFSEITDEVKGHYKLPPTAADTETHSKIAESKAVESSSIKPSKNVSKKKKGNSKRRVEDDDDSS